jgi:7-cyano-7-deazaguanine synthase
VAEQSLVLFSGGIDSTTALYWARARRGSVYALTFDYGQRHRVEVRLARRTARRAGVSQTVLKMDLTQIGGSALTDPALELPRYHRREEIKHGPPATYVPFRNGILISLAAAFAEARGYSEIVCGFNVIDSPDYPDTRAAFVRAMEKAVAAGTKAAFGGPRLKITAPFLEMTKAEIIRLGFSLGADYSYAVSCYAGDERPCGSCAACLLRRQAFAEVGRPDPLLERLGKGEGP